MTPAVARRDGGRIDGDAPGAPHRVTGWLVSGLNLLEQGITIFDADLRLVHANRRFLKLYELPDRFGEPGVTFEAINRFLAEKGDFGPGDIDAMVAERVERARAFERRHRRHTGSGQLRERQVTRTHLGRCRCADGLQQMRATASLRAPQPDHTAALRGVTHAAHGLQIRRRDDEDVESGALAQPHTEGQLLHQRAAALPRTVQARRKNIDR